jgi:hypothetical protein
MRLIVTSEKHQKVFIGVRQKVYGVSVGEQSVGYQEFSTEKLPDNAAVQSITLDEEHNHLIAAFDSKHICCWSIESGVLVGFLLLKKKPTSVVSANWGPKGTTPAPIVLLADKAGDVFATKVPEIKKDVLVGGHTASIVLDLAYLPSHQLVASADRDEKIRVSSFPDLETVVSYCLGHASVISSVSTFTTADGKALMVTAGWDHQIILWDMLTGKSLDKISLKKDAGVAEATSSSTEKVETVEEDADEEEEEAVPVEGTNGAEEENDDPDTKQYNEQDAGHYPFKLLVLSPTLLAVIFKDEKKVQIYHIQHNTQLLFQEEIALPATPLDLAMYSSDRLVILLPTPHLFAFYHVQQQTLQEITSEIVSTAHRSSIENIIAFAGKSTWMSSQISLQIFLLLC